MPGKNQKQLEETIKNIATSDATKEKKLILTGEVPDPIQENATFIYEGSEGAAPRTDYAHEERDQFGRTISDDDDYFQESLGQSQIKTRNTSLEAIEEDLEDNEEESLEEIDEYSD